MFPIPANKEDYFDEKMYANFIAAYLYFSIFACIPVPVPVGTSQPGYSGVYGYGYEDQYGYGYDDEYYDAPIIYGEPCYYAPPIAVTFAFDYFTYEPDGPYVDIVFWKTGIVTVMSPGMITEDGLLPRIFIQKNGTTGFAVPNYPVIGKSCAAIIIFLIPIPITG